MPSVKNWFWPAAPSNPFRHRKSSMSNHPSPGREALQQLLADAFAVQESQIDRQWLSAFVEIQLLIRRGDLDANAALNRVAASTRGVANADGVAIGTLEKGRLTYRAGSGTAAADVQRQLTASLTAPADFVGYREILRVEDAGQDTRIEAAICRQLGAKALLTLPLYREHVLAGVLEVRFSEPHIFDERELRTYRLMTALVEQALFPVPRLAKENLAIQPDIAHQKQIEPRTESLFRYGIAPSPTLADVLLHRSEAALKSFRESSAVRWTAMLPTTLAQRAKNVDWFKGHRKQAHHKQGYESASALTEAIQRRCQVTLTTLRESSIFRQSAALATQAKNVTWLTGHRKLATAGVVPLLGLIFWIALRGRGPASPVAPGGPAEAAIEKQVPVQDSKPAAAENTSTGSSTLVSARQVSHHAKTPARRVRVRQNEVDYIRGDVTVRYFTVKPPAPARAVRKSRVEHIGQDVTVRYFTPEPGLAPASQ